MRQFKWYKPWTWRDPRNRKLSAAVVEHIRNGKKVNAIKQLRQETGLGLKESKARVDAYYRLNPEFIQTTEF